MRSKVKKAQQLTLTKNTLKSVFFQTDALFRKLLKITMRRKGWPIADMGL